MDWQDIPTVKTTKFPWVWRTPKELLALIQSVEVELLMRTVIPPSLWLNLTRWRCSLWTWRPTTSIWLQRMQFLATLQAGPCCMTGKKPTAWKIWAQQACLTCPRDSKLIKILPSPTVGIETDSMVQDRQVLMESTLSAILHQVRCTNTPTASISTLPKMVSTSKVWTAKWWLTGWLVTGSPSETE